MKQDRQRWDQRFSLRPMTPPQAPGFIVAKTSELRSGRVLDVASGDGAAALHLASQGFDVTAVDVSSVALERLQYFASQTNMCVKTVRIDFDERKCFMGLPLFDHITLAHFKPSLELLTLLAQKLDAKGNLLLTTFNQQHHLGNGFSERFCLQPQEFLDCVPGLECVLYQSSQRDGSFMDDYHFRKVGA